MFLRHQTATCARHRCSLHKSRRLWFQATTFIKAFSSDSSVPEKHTLSYILSKGEFTAVKVPDEGHHSVTLTKWLKAEKEFVDTDGELCEIDTPDYLYTVTADFPGFIAKKMSNEGESDLEPGEVLCYLCQNEESLTLFDNLKAELPQKVDKKDTSQEFSLETWLLDIDDKYIEHADTLKANGFESKDELATITQEDLDQMQIKTGRARVILSNAKKLTSS